MGTTELTMTHLDACIQVKKSLEQVKATLEHINNEIEQGKDFIFHDSGIFDRANLLCNINWFGAYIKGAKAMYRALYNKGYLEIPHPKGWGKVTNETKLANQAQLLLYMKDVRNLEWLLTEPPQNIGIYTKFEKNPKDKIIGAKSNFYDTDTKAEIK